MHSGNRQRAARFAVAGWGVLAIGALVWQARGLVELWPERETSLHGLGGAAAHAALTSDRVGADAIYVASVDGTPRRFGAGSLPGLRYPWFKWFDPSRTLPLPPASSTAVYMLSELKGESVPGDLTQCLGSADAAGEVVIDAAQMRLACVATLGATPLNVSFDGVARIDAVATPRTGAAGERLETRLMWQPLAEHPAAYQVSLQLDDPSAGDGVLWGNGTLELYPASEWQTDESLLSRVAVATDTTALPQAYRVTLGMSPTLANAAPAMATWQGARTDRVPVATVTLTPGSGMAGSLPPDMRTVEGPQLTSGGLELIAARALPGQVAIGSPLRLGLLWRAVTDAPSAQQLRVRLVRSSGDIVQDTPLRLLGGRVSPSTLHTGNVVRDEQSLVVDARAPAEAVSVDVALDDSEPVRLGTVQLTGRAHVLDDSGQPPLATFGGSMELLAAAIEPPSVGSGAAQKVNVKLRWRNAAAMSVGYKVFVHVLDPGAQQVVAQRDAEPQDGKAPTTGWVPGEAIDDSYEVQLPASLSPGEYPVEVGVYDPRNGERLTLATGENHLVLSKPLAVSR